MSQATLEDSTELAVFQHEKRQEWGLAVLAWETSKKRGYVFENGQLRVLVQPFFAMMRQVDRPTEEVLALHETLQPELDAARAELGTVARPAARGSTPPISFEDQMTRFHEAFKEGFHDPDWVEQQRGENARRRLTAHRDPAIADAQKLLAAKELEAQLDAKAYKAIYDGLMALLGRTDLVPAAEMKPLRGADPAHQKALAQMVADLVHGAGEYGTRLEQFSSAFHRTFGSPVGWQLATALPALLAPDEHIVVRPTVFRTLAKWMAPGASIPKTPSAVSYRRCLAMAQHLRSRLDEQGEKPRDLLDVYDFIRVTVRSNSKKKAAAK